MLGLQTALAEGSLAVPVLLIKHYRKLNLSDAEAMLIIQLLEFAEREEKPFPTIEELQDRLSARPEEVIRSLQRLLKEGYLTIDQAVDPLSGVQSERYNLAPLYEKMALALAEQLEQKARPAPRDTDGKDIFSIFEMEFGRPLSPMECETISGWLDQDQYPVELVLAALKEAVFSGKVHFRYIDRILLEWSRNRIQTAEQAKEYSQRFRNHFR
jgi:DNA replication protein